MELLGEKLFAKGEDGKLVSRIGTMFFRTPGLVTRRGVHAMQRMMWIDKINADRQVRALPPLTAEEEDAEMAESVDLIFTDEFVLIRPDPERMDLAFLADGELQRLTSKRRIRFLNTSSSKVRMALCARGENWRMARPPISQEDMSDLIEQSKVPICENPIYYYNKFTGSRFITASGYAEVEKLDDAAYRRQVKEVVEGLRKRNRMGHPEVDLFPVTTPIEVKQGLRELEVDAMTAAELRAAVERISTDWRMSLTPDLREETVGNYAWRNAMCAVITQQPNESSAEEQELVSGIAPEFYRQIEWLPGARIDRGEVIFDEIYEEAARTRAPELLALCDNRVKSLLFNTTRLFGHVEFINIGRIARSLSRNPEEGSRRGHVYVMQYKETGMAQPKIVLIRLQKWGVAEHLDEGKNLLQAIFESDEYSDYVLDRRLMCRQLGMNLPHHLGFGYFTERYRGANQYNGVAMRTAYFVRDYVEGIATDKIPRLRYRNPAWAQKFAFLLGEAAATDLVVGRRSAKGNLRFDANYEVLVVGEDGLPSEIKVTDHASSFGEYERDLSDSVADYAAPVLARRDLVTEYEKFALAYVEGFRRRLQATQEAYRERRRAFDHLFSDRPYDTNGSGAYRWARALARLDAADADYLASLLKTAVGC